MIAEFASARTIFTLGSVNSSAKFSQCSCLGKSFQPGAVMSVSFDSDQVDLLSFLSLRIFPFMLWL